MSEPEIALLLSTFQRPTHLRRALQSISLQQGVEGKMELVVTDDGSTDETPRVVEEFARCVPFPVSFTTHPHTTFQLSRCRNEGARASRAPYLLFLDGDCILPRDHVRIHLERRQPGVVMAGDCCRLEQEASERITSDLIHRGEFAHFAPASELRRLQKRDRASRFYRFVGHPTKPKLIGNNVGIWRKDFERVNGYDENFQGWGCEDDDLRFRLRRAGVYIESILRWTRTYHLWHPSDATLPVAWKQGVNVRYLLRKGRLTRCRNGLHKRPLADLSIQIVGRADQPQAVARLLHGRFDSTATARPEVEILFLPGQGRFSGQADCNVLVALDSRAARSRLVRQAHLMIAPSGPAPARLCPDFSLDQFEQALGTVA
jgi:glycosyltransferase involved in cell wall biosynthesis